MQLDRQQPFRPPVSKLSPEGELDEDHTVAESVG